MIFQKIFIKKRKTFSLEEFWIETIPRESKSMDGRGYFK